MNPGGVKAVAIAGNRRPDFVGDFDGADAVCKALVAPLVLIAAGIIGKVFKLFGIRIRRALWFGSRSAWHGAGMQFSLVSMALVSRFSSAWYSRSTVSGEA